MNSRFITGQNSKQKSDLKKHALTEMIDRENFLRCFVGIVHLDFFLRLK